MKLRMTIVIIILIVVFGGIFGWNYFKSLMIKEYMAKMPEPTQTISSTKVKHVSWQQFLTSVGSLRAYHAVSITPQQSGQVNKIYFKAGSIVKLGEALIEQNTDIDQQELLNQQAALNLDKISYDRQFKLFKSGNASAQAMDEAKSKFQQAQAVYNETKVTIEQKTIRAPFTGKIGIRNVNLGQYITPNNDSNLVTLESLNPLQLIFSLPEQFYSQIKKGLTVEFSVESHPAKTFTGTVTAVDSSINVDTRNIQIQANVPNKDLSLYPGMFANVKLLLPKESQVLIVPQTAIAYSLFGDTVYVLTPDTKKQTAMPGKKQTAKTPPKKRYIAKQVVVTVGDKRGNFVAITEGLNVGDQIVTSGQLKLHPNSVVNIDNSVNVSAMPKQITEES